MAGFVKIWTTLRSQDWWLELAANQRNCYSEAILMCKEQADDRHVTCKNVTDLAGSLGVDYRTMRRVIDNFVGRGLWVVKEAPRGTIDIEIVDYEYWQGLKSYSDHKHNRRVSDKNVVPSQQNTANRADRLEQSRAEQITGKSVSNETEVEEGKIDW